MTDGPLVLGIDDGTTAVKVTLFDAELQAVASARRPVATAHPAPGRVEQDPGEVLQAVVDAVAEVLPAAAGRPVVATGLDHQGESVLAWHPVTREPVSPIIVWQDKRGIEVYDKVDPELLARTGLPPDPYFSAPKLAWLVREHGPDVRLGTVDAWLSDRLGAGWATDPSTASRTALQVLGDVGWDTALCIAFGIPRTSLPEIRPTAGDLGTLHHERWDVDLPLRARVCDQQAALAGAGCVLPGRAKATYGTGVFVLAHTGATPPHAEGLLPTVAWQASGRVDYALDGGVFTAGALLEWLSGTLGLAADPERLTALAATVPDAGGVRVLPALAGAGAPWWRPEARGVIAGLTGGTTKAHIARAAVEAIAHRVADVVDAMGGVDVLRIDGGLTNDPLLCRLQADLLGVAVERSAADATVAGAAGLALVGAGLLDDVRDLDGLLAPGERIEPQLAAAERQAARATWSAFVQRALALH
ncbi:MAG TPA: FGGY family carbohydrate kinase [Baekduia sp.]|uniref:FGGY family carbohydrate kinase n=1 Tax=Baekduia sp. TaxID=2600305 RepID=UPI002C3C6595|nr:FGGY family carbohydrate kinase [Baekduia sp.]HMJ32695.1 FGGY family carbohydrate kinase [Baekduia sp.]